MTTPHSPTHMFNGLDEDSYANDAKFAHEINDKMRVPKRIKATGEYSDDDLLLSNQTGLINSWNYHDKIDMSVPDRIVVLGHNQHLETRSAPLEIQLENSILPKDTTGVIRVQTPPRSITLNEHHFPSASEQNSPREFLNGNVYIDENLDDETLERTTPYAKANGQINAVDSNSVESESQMTTAGSSKRSSHVVTYQPHDTSIISLREGVAISDLTPHEEILYLRRQLAKLNRRVLNIEVCNEQRLQREKIVYCLGLAYFILKALLWMNRN